MGLEESRCAGHNRGKLFANFRSMDTEQLQSMETNRLMGPL